MKWWDTIIIVILLTFLKSIQARLRKTTRIMCIIRMQNEKKVVFREEIEKNILCFREKSAVYISVFRDIIKKSTEKRGMYMVFKRKVYDKLLEWKKLSAGASAVLLEGASVLEKVRS